MGLQIVNEGAQAHPSIVEEVYDRVEKKRVNTDVRRKLEKKLEELELQKDVQEFDFDI